MYTRSLSICNR